MSLWHLGAAPQLSVTQHIDVVIVKPYVLNMPKKNNVIQIKILECAGLVLVLTIKHIEDICCDTIGLIKIFIKLFMYSLI